MILPPSVPTGIPPGDHDPIYVNLYSNDRAQQILNSSLHQGHVQNPGVILTDDNDKIPLPMLIWINDNKTEISRPVTSVLFRDIDTTGDRKGASANELYEKLKSELPDNLKTQLEKNDQLYFTQQDPDLIAFDQSLKFASSLLATLSDLGQKDPISSERAQAGIKNFNALPNEVTKNIITFCSLINQELTNYLEKIGPNKPGFDILLNASNQVKDALAILKSK